MPKKLKAILEKEKQNVTEDSKNPNTKVFEFKNPTETDIKTQKIDKTKITLNIFEFSQSAKGGGNKKRRNTKEIKHKVRKTRRSKTMLVKKNIVKDNQADEIKIK